MDIKEDYSIVMKEDSSMVKIKNKENMGIGDSIIFLDEDLYIESSIKSTKSKVITSLLAIAAALVFVILPTVKTNVGTSYAILSLDINPSIEIELDKNKKIVKAYGVNEDGKDIDLDELKGLTLDTGLDKLKNTLRDMNISTDNNIIVGFAFLTDEEDSEFEKEIKSIIDERLKESETVYLKGSKEDVNKSKEKGISLGRYEINNKFNDKLTEEDIEKMSVEELIGILNRSSNLDKDTREEIEDEIEDYIDEQSDHDRDEDNEDIEEIEDTNLDDDDDYDINEHDESNDGDYDSDEDNKSTESEWNNKDDSDDLNDDSDEDEDNSDDENDDEDDDFDDSGNEDD